MKTKTPNTSAIVKSFVTKAKPLSTKLQKLVIVTKEDYKKAGTLMKELKEQGKAAKEKMAEQTDRFDRIIKESKDGKADITTLFKPFFDSIALIETQVKTAMLEWQEDQDKKVKQLEQKFADGKIKNVSTLTTKVEELKAPKVAGTKIVKKMVVQITSLKDVPREFMVPDLSAIDAALKEGKKVKGCTLVEQKSISI